MATTHDNDAGHAASEFGYGKYYAETEAADDVLQTLREDYLVDDYPKIATCLLAQPTTLWRLAQVAAMHEYMARVVRCAAGCAADGRTSAPDLVGFAQSKQGKPLPRTLDEMSATAFCLGFAQQYLAELTKGLETLKAIGESLATSSSGHDAE